MRRTSGAVPTEFAATGKATTRVRSRELPLQIVVVERHVVGHLDEADDDAEVVLQLQPRRHVRVVVELRHEHLVAGSERPRERPREEEVEPRHARPERDLLVAAAEEARPHVDARARSSASVRREVS